MLILSSLISSRELLLLLLLLDLVTLEASVRWTLFCFRIFHSLIRFIFCFHFKSFKMLMWIYWTIFQVFALSKNSWVIFIFKSLIATNLWDASNIPSRPFGSISGTITSCVIKVERQPVFVQTILFIPFYDHVFNIKKKSSY